MGERCGTSEERVELEGKIGAEGGQEVDPGLRARDEWLQ
jgi:hypothetical protein